MTVKDVSSLVSSDVSKKETITPLSLGAPPEATPIEICAVTRNTDESKPWKEAEFADAAHLSIGGGKAKT